MKSLEQCQEIGHETNKLYSFTLIPPSSFNGISKSEFVLSCNFDHLAKQYPEFQDAWSQAVSSGETSRTAAPFNSTVFNKALTRSLLHHHFHLLLPSLPEGTLCPPIPNRANYVLWLRELIASCAYDLERFSSRCPEGEHGEHQVQPCNQIKTANQMELRFQGIDIGTGVSAIYPLLLCTSLFAQSDALMDRERDGNITDSSPNSEMSNAHYSSRRIEKTQRRSDVFWKFLATDIDPLAVESARTNVEANHLENQICVVQVESSSNRNDSYLPSDEQNQNNALEGPLFAAMTEAKCSDMFQISKLSTTNKTHTTTNQCDVQDLSTFPKFDFVMTNPPFYSTLEEANTPRAGDKRSRTEMTLNEAVYSHSYHHDFNYDKTGTENFRDVTKGQSGSSDEGGDVGFIMAIMKDSQFFRHHVTWYTSLVAKRSSLEIVLHRLQTLDGIWGNRGQIRTVEFRQGSMGFDNGQDGNSRKDGAMRCNPRVRWGIGWTYERAAARCRACRVISGLTYFNVSMSGKTSNADSVVDANGDENYDSGCGNGTAAYLDEIVSRLMAYFNSFREPSLTCTRHIRNGSPCVTAIEKRFDNSASFYATSHKLEEDNENLPVAGHFLIDTFVRAATSGSDTPSEQTGIEFEVIIEAYSHTKHGSVLVDKIRGPMPGEIRRTNRRWRRLKKTGYAR